MASSRKDLLNRYAELGFRHGDVRGAQTAIRLEIEERKEQYQELKKEIEDRPSQNNNNNNEIKKNSNDISALLKQIKSLQSEVALLKNVSTVSKVTKKKTT